MTAATSPLGFAVLGCGYWGINYVRVLNELPNTRVVAVCDQRTERLKEVGRRFPEMLLTTQLDEVLQQADVDAVVVCTEAQTHHDLTSRCLAAGKHVLVEKPLTTTVSEADQLVALAEKQRATLMVGHTFLYNAGVRKVKEYIAEDAIGQVYYLYARRTNLGPVRRDVNAVWDLATHDIAIFNYLLGAVPLWVSAVGANVLRNDRVDVGFVSLGYSNGVVGHIHVSWAEPNKVREVVVVGSERRIVFNDLDAMERVRVFEKGMAVTSEASNYGEYQLQMRDGGIFSPQIEVNEPLKTQCGHFVECIQTGRRPFTSGSEGRDVVRVLAAIDRSIKLHGSSVEVL